MKPKYLDQRLAYNRCLNFLKFILFCLCWVSVFTAVYGLSLVAASRGYFLVLHLSRRWFLLLQSTDSRVRASVVAEQWLSFPMAGEVFPDQGLNPSPLHWQVDSFFFFGRWILNHWTTREVFSLSFFIQPVDRYLPSTYYGPTQTRRSILLVRRGTGLPGAS